MLGHRLANQLLAQLMVRFDHFDEVVPVFVAWRVVCLVKRDHEPGL